MKNDAIGEVLTRSVDTVYPSRDALRARLESGKPITLYLGVDPTGPHIHLGHATNLLVLKRFQDLGHKVILLIGDFTARIGDPTDKSAARQPLTVKQVKDNLKTFKSQVSKIVRFSGKNAAQVVFNSKWHEKMRFAEIVQLASHFTVQQMVERDMFQERIKAGKPVGLHEFMYPLMQGYDSVALGVDLEIGGTDQTFNMMAGRSLVRDYLNREKFVLTTKLLVNPQTGKKIMNKSEGGLVNLDDEPNDMFGKIMSLPDDAIVPIAEFSTELPMERVRSLAQISKENPRDAKLSVAYEVVRLYHSEKEAATANAEWVRTFSDRGTPTNISVLSVTTGTIGTLIMAAGVESSSEARRLILQRAIKLNDEVVTDPKLPASAAKGKILKVGKHRFFKVK